ncbi:lysylphosphatidylglycerol synthase transmembrane domain-containing protein [Mariniphaga anaerophila]|uniref:lysylphosphatidylglycerol synthase transmembrane domain-containing protein n=1 Tax=Mariniphaga anaerophila TaxID=1484053 RepID=UPI0009340BAA|nr:lysylphosphatidylglycerol synthase transmembrane domain-containing protein [Mariniphaga anaerophila]
MKKIAIKTIKFLTFFAIGVSIFWLIYKDQDIEHIKSVLKNDVNYFWIIISLFIGLLSHISRTIRWRLMVEPIGHKPNFINTFLAVMVGYLMNMVFPRMGELSRCGVLARYEKVSFTKLIGTVVAERAVDMLSLLVLLTIVIFSQAGQMIRFINDNPEIETKIMGLITSPILIGGLVALVVLAFIFRKTLQHTIFYKKIFTIFNNLKEGFISVRGIKKKGWFFFHSVAIWVLYYLMLYVVFFSFGFTSHLGPIAGLTTFVLASFGMVAPVQGGMGAWHFMATEALALYGVAKTNGVIFAFVAHTSMTVMIIVIGIISVLILPFINRRNYPAPEQPVPETTD